MPPLTYDQIANHTIFRRFYYLAWRLIGVNISLLSPDRKKYIEFGATERWSQFCITMRNTIGAGRCDACDQEHLDLVEQQKKPIRNRCWLGLREFVAPIMLNGEILAFIRYGQCLDAPPKEEDWIATSKILTEAGLPDAEALKNLFFSLWVIPPQTQQDLMALLELFGNYLVYAQYQIGLSEESRQAQVAERALSFIRNHFTEPLKLEDVALAANTSKRNLSRIFDCKFGKTVLQTIHETRIAKACQLLQTEEITSLKVAMDCGFGSVQQFNRVFNKIHRCSPQTWRRQYQTTGHPEDPAKIL